MDLFISDVLNADAEDQQWEYYLHKVYDQSFDDFKKRIKDASKTKADREEEAKAALTDTLSIYDTFNKEVMT